MPIENARVFVAKRSGKLHFRTDATNDATIDNLFVSEVYVEEFEPYSEQPLTYQTPNGLHGIPLGKTIPSAIANSEIHMRGVYWDNMEQQYYIGNTKNENGKDVQRVGEHIFDGTEKYTYYASGTDVLPRYCGNNVMDISFGICLSNMCSYAYNHATLVKTVNSIAILSGGCVCFHLKGFKGIGEETPYPSYGDLGNAINVKLKELYDSGTPFKVYYILAEPIVTDTSEEELAQFNALRMNYPNTTIVNDANAYTEVEYVCDTQEHIKQNYAPKSEIQEMKDQIAELQALMVNNS